MTGSFYGRSNLQLQPLFAQKFNSDFAPAKSGGQRRRSGFLLGFRSLFMGRAIKLREGRFFSWGHTQLFLFYFFWEGGCVKKTSQTPLSIINRLAQVSVRVICDFPFKYFNSSLLVIGLHRCFTAILTDVPPKSPQHVPLPVK